MIEVRTERAANVALHERSWEAVGKRAAQRAEQGSSGGEQRQQRLQLELGLRELRRGVGVAHDAHAGIAMRDLAAQQRAAQRDAELAVARRVRSTPPGPRTSRGPVPRARGSARAPAAPDAPHRGRRMEVLEQLDRVAWIRELRADRRPQMLDVRDAHEHRLGGCGDPQRVRVQDAPSIRLATIACSSRSFAARDQLLAEVGVDGGVRASPRRSGERHRRDALPFAAHQQLGARGDESSPRRGRRRR